MFLFIVCLVFPGLTGFIPCFYNKAEINLMEVKKEGISKKVCNVVFYKETAFIM